MPDAAAFRAKFPQAKHFPLVTDAEITEALVEATLIHSVRELATLYCAAHLLALEHEYFDELGRPVSSPDGGSGVVTAETIGPQNKTFATMVGNMSSRRAAHRAFFATTPYGRHFLTLEARTPAVGIGIRLV